MFFSDLFFSRPVRSDLVLIKDTKAQIGLKNILFIRKNNYVFSCGNTGGEYKDNAVMLAFFASSLLASSYVLYGVQLRVFSVIFGYPGVDLGTFA